MEDRPVATLWKDYLFLTQEMRKLLTEEPDMELFMELMDQRGRMQELIEQQLDEDYVFTSPGREVMMDIDRENKAMRLRLQFLMNQMRSREKVNQAYDAIGENSAGKRMDYRK